MSADTQPHTDFSYPQNGTLLSLLSFYFFTLSYFSHTFTLHYSHDRFFTSFSFSSHSSSLPRTLFLSSSSLFHLFLLSLSLIHPPLHLHSSLFTSFQSHPPPSHFHSLFIHLSVLFLSSPFVLYAIVLPAITRFVSRPYTPSHLSPAFPYSLLSPLVGHRHSHSIVVAVFFFYFFWFKCVITLVATTFTIVSTVINPSFEWAILPETSTRSDLSLMAHHNSNSNSNNTKKKRAL